MMAWRCCLLEGSGACCFSFLSFGREAAPRLGLLISDDLLNVLAWHKQRCYYSVKFCLCMQKNFPYTDTPKIKSTDASVLLCRSTRRPAVRRICYLSTGSLINPQIRTSNIILNPQCTRRDKIWLSHRPPHRAAKHYYAFVF